MNNKTGKETNQIAIVGPVSGQTRALKRDIIEDVVDVSHLRASFSNFLTSLQEIVGAEVPSAGTYELDQIQFSAEISAKGELKLLGTGIGLEGKGGVTFTLKRKTNP